MTLAELVTRDFVEAAWRAIVDKRTQNIEPGRLWVSADWNVKPGSKVWGLPVTTDPTLPPQTIEARQSCWGGRHHWSKSGVFVSKMDVDADGWAHFSDTLPGPRCLRCGEVPM